MASFPSFLLPMPSIPKTDSSWLSGVFDSIGGAVQRGKENASFNALADRIGANTSPAPASSTASSFGTAPVIPVDRGPIPDAYYGAIRSAESGGNDSAKNPRSSATGRYQFTEGTWNGLASRYPELGLTADGRLDPNQQERAIRVFTQDNARALTSAGIPVNPGNLYAAHFLGAGGATAVLGQDDASPVSTLVGADVVKANPFLDGMTVGQFKQWAASKSGNGSGGYSAPTSVDAVNAMASGSPMTSRDPGQVADASGMIAPGVTPIQRGGVDPETIQFMLRDPNLREIGVKLWAANAGQQRPNEPWQFVTLPDGTLARANQQTGAIERVGQFSKPEKPEEPKIVELFDDATGQPYKAQWNPQTRTYDRVGGVKARSGMQLTTNPDGTVTLTEGSIGNMPKLSEAEGRNAGFYGRGVESHNVLNTLEDQGTSLWNKTAGNVPIVGNFLRSEDAQKYDQAKRNFINAVLRRESGAVIADEEFANADQQYFPQPGDGPEVIAQKRRNREVTIQGLKVSSGQGANFAIPPQESRQTGTPAAGAVEDGYRFRGGDPADPKNWEKVR